MNIHVQFGFKNLTGEKDCRLLVHLDQTIAINWRLSSVVYKLFTFQASSPKPLDQLEPNLAVDHPMNIHVQFGFNHICSF
jgi:hypothetical protein